MDLFETIFTRRSIRSYKSDPVSDEHIQKILRAAMAAPSAGNAQTWQFLIIKDRNKLDAVPDFHAYCKMIKETPVAILICGDLSKEKYEGYWVQDCSAATQNLLLAARALGLGSVWTGIYPDKARVDGCRTLFQVPDAYVPFALVPLGWPKGEFKEVDRYSADAVHVDTW